MENKYNFDRLKELIEKLRAPDGCPWDKKQTPESLVPQFLEEVYELIDAIHEKNPDKIKEELGDVLLHIVFQIIFGKENKKFGENDVFKEIIEKIIRRHPHVFGSLRTNDITEINKNWENIKKGEQGKENRKFFDDIPNSMPALLKSYKLTKKVAKVGFDWPDISNIFEKLNEELNELEEALIKKDNQNIEEEIGDVFFMLVNLSRFLNINPEEALIKTNKKFIKRFLYIEKELEKIGKNIENSNLEEMEIYWEQVKKQ